MPLQVSTLTVSVIRTCWDGMERVNQSKICLLHASPIHLCVSPTAHHINLFINIPRDRTGVRDLVDAQRVLEAVRLRILPLITRRLRPQERAILSSGNVFVWEESEAEDGLARWTDGRAWSQSKMRSDCLFYEEKLALSEDEKAAKAVRRAMKAKNGCAEIPAAPKRRDRPTKVDGLRKQTYSVLIHPPGATSPRRWHLVAYHSIADAPNLPVIEDFDYLKNICIPEGVFVALSPTSVPPHPSRPYRHVVNVNDGPERRRDELERLPYVRSRTGRRRAYLTPYRGYTGYAVLVALCIVFAIAAGMCYRTNAYRRHMRSLVAAEIMRGQAAGTAATQAAEAALGPKPDLFNVYVVEDFADEKKGGVRWGDLLPIAVTRHDKGSALLSVAHVSVMIRMPHGDLPLSPSEPESERNLSALEMGLCETPYVDKHDASVRL
ncbi:unnamed protein product [Mycena citricolor]|uniref:Gti1/Pac2 family-domain-containing protein n=1 Tax=Mycena citricolor TaxID=2018698 RepID=A0AAD2K462_9AGAR|nr:unnamed protein product [Mycena citricolor]